MTPELWISFAGALFAALATIVAAWIAVRGNRDRKRTEERAKRREEESRLSMEMMAASIELGMVTSLAVTGGHTNGNVEAAQKKASAAKEKYEDFIKRTAAHAIVKV